MHKHTPEEYMRRAIQLSVQARGYTAPNPMVGCVVVKDGRIISEGYHERCGEYHAERNALLHCKEDPEGAELYVTLEPCCHYGKTPPCTQIIIEKKIAKVYVGAMDSNPLVAGKGVAQLRQAGICVETGVLEQECRDVNEVFFHYMEHKMPFVALKYAMTLDGKIACESGDSKWITGEESRMYVQQLRKWYRGIMAGIGTVLADDPLLTCRIAPDCNPVRIICDTHLRIPLQSQIVKTADVVPTIVAYSEEGLSKEQQAKKQQLRENGIQLLSVALQGKSLSMPALLQALAQQGIDSILVEGGGMVNAALLQAHLIQRVYAFTAPKLVGGKEASSPITGKGILKMKDAVMLEQVQLQQFGQDVMLTGRVKGES